jgi:hypothetical protein
MREIELDVVCALCDRVKLFRLNEEEGPVDVTGEAERAELGSKSTPENKVRDEGRENAFELVLGRDPRAGTEEEELIGGVCCTASEAGPTGEVESRGGEIMFAIALKLASSAGCTGDIVRCAAASIAMGPEPDPIPAVALMPNSATFGDGLGLGVSNALGLGGGGLLAVALESMELVEGGREDVRLVMTGFFNLLWKRTSVPEKRPTTPSQ